MHGAIKEDERSKTTNMFYLQSQASKATIKETISTCQKKKRTISARVYGSVVFLYKANLESTSKTMKLKKPAHGQDSLLRYPIYGYVKRN